MWVTVHCAISFGKVLLKSLVNFENKIIFCVFSDFAFYSVLFAALKLFLLVCYLQNIMLRFLLRLNWTYKSNWKIDSFAFFPLYHWPTFLGLSLIFIWDRIILNCSDWYWTHSEIQEVIELLELQSLVDFSLLNWWTWIPYSDIGMVFFEIGHDYLNFSIFFTLTEYFLYELPRMVSGAQYFISCDIISMKF